MGKRNDGRGVWAISSDHKFDLTVPEAYRMLSVPSVQLLWNTELLAARLREDGEIADGTVAYYSFRESGKRTVVYDEVIPEHEFTQVFCLRVISLFNLGFFRHRYQFWSHEGKTTVRQTVLYELSGLGRLFKTSISRRLTDRNWERMHELARFCERQTVPGNTPPDRPRL